MGKQFEVRVYNPEVDQYFQCLITEAQITSMDDANLGRWFRPMLDRLIQEGTS